MKSRKAQYAFFAGWPGFALVVAIVVLFLLPLGILSWAAFFKLMQALSSPWIIVVAAVLIFYLVRGR